MTELWFRNPRNYPTELQAVMSEFSVIWDTALLQHWSLDPFTYMSMQFGYKGQWRYMVVYGLERYVELWGNDRNLLGVFPLWDAVEDDPELLIEYLEDAEFLKRTVAGQEHRVVITSLDVQQRWDQIYELSQLQKKHPEVKFHIYNTYSFKLLFGMGFYSGDFHPKDAAGMGQIILPSGRSMRQNRGASFQDGKLWIESLGFDPQELETSRQQRVKYNIVSASWAAKYFSTLDSISAKKTRFVPIDNALATTIIKTKTPLTKTGLAIQEGDKKACDFCSLWASCRYYREGSVCTMPDSDYKEIAEALGTRDAYSIGTGISKLLKVNVERIEEARTLEASRAKAIGDSLGEEEDTSGKKKPMGPIDPELTKLIDSTIKQGIALANLYKVPNEKGRVIIQVTGGVDSSAGAISMPPVAARELAAKAVQEIEASGVPLEEITEDHVNQWLAENIVEGETA